MGEWSVGPLLDDSDMMAAKCNERPEKDGEIAVRRPSESALRVHGVTALSIKRQY